MKVAYILDGFPNTSETFISDEIGSVMQAQNISCEIYSLKQPTSKIINLRTQDLLINCQIDYYKNKSIYNDLLSFITVFRKRPLSSITTVFKAFFCKKQRWFARKALHISKAVLKSGATHLHSHFADQATEVAMWVSRFTKIPYSFTTHGYDIFFDPPENFKELSVCSKFVICISKFNMTFLQENFEVPKSKLPIIHCGIYLTEFPFFSRKKWMAPNEIKLVAVGRLVEVKGHCYLLDAISTLQLEGINVSLTIVGDGPLFDILQHQAAELNITNHIELAGAKTSNEIYQYLIMADIFVMPSISESMGVATMEAMASGTPVIATAVRGVPELVVDGVTGVLCPPKNSIALAEAIKFISKNPEIVNRMRLQAREKIEREFDRLECTKELIALWRQAEYS